LNAMQYINFELTLHSKQAMWLMLQQEAPQDYVIATNEVHSVREFVEASFREINRKIV
jgi:GDPmannose 4,6-dehydratase